MMIEARIKVKLPIKRLILLAAFTGISLCALALNQGQASAAYVNGANLIDNVVFRDTSTMSRSQVQSFLAGKNSGLRNMSFTFDCYGPNSKEREWYTAIGAPCDQQASAADIIYFASRIYGVNPQVVLATLQKEQSLVTNPNPSQWNINNAMGYNCPTSGSCSTPGFFVQLDHGTWALRLHYERARGNMTWWSNASSWTCGTEKSLYKPNLYPGTNTRFYDQDGVHYRTYRIANAATAALYCYTPHTYNNPNGLHGLPAYGSTGRYYSGSYWFVVRFTQWFGPVTGVHVRAVPYDTTTDKTGEPATVGFHLSHRPTSNVTLSFNVNTPSNAKIKGPSTVTITPNTWNRPEINTITVTGLDNPHLVGTFRYWLVPISKPVSSDNRFSRLTPEQIGSVSLVQLDTANPANVYRLYSPSLQQHYFTASMLERNARIAEGWTDEGTRFSYCQAGEQTIYRMVKGDERRLVVARSSQQADASANGFRLETVSFATSTQGTVPIYWLHDSSKNRHLYSTNPNEGTPSFTNKGVAFYACEQDKEPVYRFYNPATGNHFYTTSASERDNVLFTHRFRYERLGFYICDNGTRDVYRLFNPATGNHFYTTSASERDNAVSQHGFRSEGVAFRAR